MRNLADQLVDPRPGDVPSARQQRLVNRILRSLARVRGENGISVRFSDRGLVIGMRRPPAKTSLDAVITNAPPPGVRIMPGDCVYNVNVVGQPAATLVEVMPRYGRPVRSDGGPGGKGEMAIYPARVNDRCYVVVERDESNQIIRSLHVISEEIAGAPCTPTPAAAAGGGGGGGGCGCEEQTPDFEPPPALAPDSGGSAGDAGESGAPGRG